MGSIESSLTVGADVIPPEILEQKSMTPDEIEAILISFRTSQNDDRDKLIRDLYESQEMNEKDDTWTDLIINLPGDFDPVTPFDFDLYSSTEEEITNDSIQVMDILAKDSQVESFESTFVKDNHTEVTSFRFKLGHTIWEEESRGI